MYEVRWTMIGGHDIDLPYDHEGDARQFFHALEENPYIDSVGLYYTDGDGAEKELAVWSR